MGWVLVLILLHDVLGPVYTVHVKFQPSNIAFNTSSKQLLLENIYFFLLPSFSIWFFSQPQEDEGEEGEEDEGEEDEDEDGEEEEESEEAGKDEASANKDWDQEHWQQCKLVTRCCCNF